MKFLTIALAVSGVAAASASLGAQTTLPARSGVYTTVNPTDCSYARTTNGLGDIIFGRTNVSTNCRDVYSRVDGAWYQVGRGANNNSIYERRIRNANGDLVIQRARRYPNGSFRIISTRLANSNDKEWRKAQKAQQKALKKEEKADQKASRKEEKAERKAEKNYYKGK
jgi:hypothetical protein